MTDKKVPQWAVDYITEWKARLILHEWETATLLSATPNQDGAGSTLACVNIVWDIRHARIEILDNIPADKPEGEELARWQKVIIHELMHIRLAGIACLIDDEILPEFSSATRSVLDKMFRREVEPFVEIMASILHDLSVTNDHPN